MEVYRATLGSFETGSKLSTSFKTLREASTWADQCLNDMHYDHYSIAAIDTETWAEQEVWTDVRAAWVRSVTKAVQDGAKARKEAHKAL